MNNNWVEEDLETLAQEYKANPTVQNLYLFLKAYAQDPDISPDGYVSNMSARMMHHLVEKQNEIKELLKMESLPFLENMEVSMDGNIGGIDEKGHFFLDENENNNNNIMNNMDSAQISQAKLTQLENDANIIHGVIREAIHEIKQTPLGLALSLGQKKNIPSNVLRHISGFTAPSSINYIGRVNKVFEEREKKAKANQQLAIQIAETPALRQTVQESSKKGCLGNRCSIMGGSKKRKSKKSKSKKTKRSRKH